MSEKYQYHFGVRFYRDEQTGYYINSSLITRAHRFVWEKHNGPIPEGMHIHHIDEDKSNNDISNLQMLPASEHLSMHMKERVKDPVIKARMDENLHNIRHLTKAWHSSPEGLEWHRKQGSQVFQNMKPRDYVCDQCGVGFSTTPHGNNRFCSNKCKYAWRRDAGLDDIEKTCMFCEGIFVGNKYAKQETCSRGCANRLRFKRKSENARSKEESL